jgi:hypothetical protein
MRQRPDAAALQERNRYAADLRACDLPVSAAHNSTAPGASPAAAGHHSLPAGAGLRSLRQLPLAAGLPLEEYSGSIGFLKALSQVAAARSASCGSQMAKTPCAQTLISRGLRHVGFASKSDLSADIAGGLKSANNGREKLVGNMLEKRWLLQEE